MIEKVPMTQVGATKLRELEARGFEIAGVILVDRKVEKDGTHRRATVDNFGRVQWWDVDGSGQMIAAKSASKNELIDRLRALSMEMKEVGTQIDYFGGLARYAKHGAELVGAATIVEDWIFEMSNE